MTDAQKRRLLEIAAEVIFGDYIGFLPPEIYRRFTDEFGLVEAGEVYKRAIAICEAI
ncbi:MAG: hypothetical protein ACYSW6_07770 [Planctomycetota bacterium]|jgi:hypothetical protein